MGVTVTEDVSVLVFPPTLVPSVYDSVTVQEDISTFIPFLVPNVYDNVSITEDIGCNLLCLIKPTTAAVNLWSKLENAGDVTSPDVGTGGAEVGSPTYVASKFGNGILSDIDNEGCTFPTAANSINANKGTIEFWAKLNYTPTEAFLHWLFTFRAADGQNGIFLYFSKYTDDFVLQVQRAGGGVAVINTAGVSWNSGDLLHFGVSWDREGNDLGDSKTLVLYIENVEEGSSSTTWDEITGIGANLILGTMCDGAYHSDAVIDNLKTYNTCKVDFSDKDVEGLATTGPVESVSLTESIVMHSYSFIDVYDSVGVTDVDAVYLLTLFNLYVYDSPSVTESIGRNLLMFPSVYDSTAITESVSSVTNIGVDVYDSVSITEYIKKKLLAFISVNDTATITEYISAVAITAGISVYEATTIFEKIYLDLWIQRIQENDIEAWTERTKEDDIEAWTERTKEDDTEAWTERTNKET